MMDQHQQTAPPMSVFYSYAHEDETLRNELEKHLSLLQRQGIITAWYDRRIVPGTDWALDVDHHLNEASIILLLISPDFLASDYCFNVEMQRALERHRFGEACVIPVILRPVYWHEAPFAHLQCLPRNAKPVTEWENRDTAFRDITRGIRYAVEQMRRTVRPLSPLNHQDRQRFLKRIRTRWIDGVLERSLHQGALIEMGLHHRPDALDNPWHLVIQETDCPARSLAPGTRIIQVFDDADGQLLILGDPGVGKTTLLLELAHELLDRAVQNEQHAMPTVFHLSSWAQKCQPLAAWLVEELQAKYQVPYKVAQAWIDTNQVLPLLDGLDEVSASSRSACIAAINVYHQDHWLNPLVVCSRSTEYFEQTMRVTLQVAVAVDPLTSQQIDEYLAYAGRPLEGIRTALHSDPELQELVKTPLMLNIVTLAYHGTSLENLTGIRDPDLQRQQVFATYVECLLTRRGVHPQYTKEQTKYWLAWLARQMRQHSQTEFYLERMQPDWLPPRRWRRFYRTANELFSGLLAGSLITLGLGLLVGLFGGLLFWLVNALVFGLFFGLLSALFGELLYGLVIRQPGPGSREKIRPTEIVHWSWKNVQKHIPLSLFILIMGSLSSVFLGAMLSGLVAQLLNYKTKPEEVVFIPIGHGGIGLWLKEATWVGFRPESAFIAVLLLMLIISLVENGLSPDMLPSHDIVLPGYGIQCSAQNGRRVGLLFGLFSALFGGLVIGLFSGLTSGLINGFIIGLIIGVFSWSIGGGSAYVKQMTLLWMLQHASVIPRNYIHFLDYAYEHILLQKVGGGYIFVHRLLLDYFASLPLTTP